MQMECRQEADVSLSQSIKTILVWHDRFVCRWGSEPSWHAPWTQSTGSQGESILHQSRVLCRQCCYQIEFSLHVIFMWLCTTNWMSAIRILKQHHVRGVCHCSSSQLRAYESNDPRVDCVLSSLRLLHPRSTALAAETWSRQRYI